VAYVESPGRSNRIAVRSTAESGGGLHPAEESGGNQAFPAWTSDGESIRFCDYSFPRCDWKQVGRLGGFVQAIDVRRSFQRAWSADEERSVFAIADSIYTDSALGGDSRLLGIHPAPVWAPHSFTWSPDGRWIAYVNGNPLWVLGPNVAPSSVWILDSIGGTPIRVTDQEYLNVSPQWLPDSRHLLFVSDRDGARGVYVVEVGPEGPEGTPRSVLPSSDPHSISISADGRKLAYSRLIAKSNVWSIPIPRSGPVSVGEAAPVTEGTQLVETHDVSPDGEWIAFDSKRRGELDIYKQRLDGGSPQLVADVSSDAYEPDWSPDGTEIAFYSIEGQIFVVSADGGNPEVIVDFPGFDGGSRWSPDGLSIAFESEGPESELPNKMWIVSRDSVGMSWSDPVQLTEFGCGEPEWAPDGESLLCFGSEVGWVRVSVSGEVSQRYESLRGLRGFSRPRFSPDGERLYFGAIDEAGWDGLWWMPADGGEPARVVAFDDPAMAVFIRSLSVGPKHLYFTIDETESDIRVVDLDW
jgi:TolB protein